MGYSVCLHKEGRLSGSRESTCVHFMYVHTWAASQSKQAPPSRGKRNWVREVGAGGEK